VRSGLLAPILAFVLFASAPVHCQALETLSADFTLRTKRGASVETVRGSLYHVAPAKTILRVTEPVTQWSIFEGGTLLIYYPAERRAFRFVSRNRLLIPFSYSFIGLVKEDFGLADAGFQLESTEVRGDALMSTWSPPPAVSGVIGRAVVGIREDRPFLLELYGPNDSLSVRVEYGEYFESGFLAFPTRAKTVQFEGESSTEEVYTYESFAVNAELPEEVAGFALPDDVEVKEVHW